MQRVSGAEPQYLRIVHKRKGLYAIAVDVRQEFANMRGWCLGNPTKRKTRSGVRRFVAAWLAKEQNRSKGRDAPVNRYADIDAWAMEGE